MDGLPQIDLGSTYIVERLIGAGAMGRVYLARDLKHDRLVAVKVLDPGYRDFVGSRRFLQEIQFAAQLAHPHIVPLYDSGQAGNLLYYVMPLIEEDTLRSRLEREGALPVPQAVEWTLQVAGALAHAHARGIIHRDIKPGNLLLRDGQILIADFGIARAVDLASDDRLTSGQMVLGSRMYMSPEQATGTLRLDGRSDLYSLACVFYEMLAGEPPFGGANAQAVTAKKLAGEYTRLRVLRPTLPGALDRWLKRALAPLPADRYRDAEAFAHALTTAAQPADRYRVVAWGVGAALATFAGMGLWWWTASRPDPIRTESGRQRVVVGRFENRTGNPVYDALGLMASDWITEGLQRTGAVDVVPTPTSLAAGIGIRDSGAADPAGALARATRADLVVLGAIYLDRDSLVLQAQLADAGRRRLIGAVEPIRALPGEPAPALQRLRERLMGLLALSLDDRLSEPDRPPTYEAYQTFAGGMESYVRNDDASALPQFERAWALDTTFVLPLLYAAIAASNLSWYGRADSLLRQLAPYRGQLNPYDRAWYDFRVAHLAGRDAEALAAIRRAAALAPNSKATYNFAVQAFEMRQPFVAESALHTLSPDLGPMRGYVRYWDVLCLALHAQERYDVELQMARVERERYPYRLEGYRSGARALAALGRNDELSRWWREATTATTSKGVELGELALEAAFELQAHGYPVLARPWALRARESFTPAPSEPDLLSNRFGRARAAAIVGWPSEARSLLESLSVEAPGRQDIRGWLGVVQVEQGDSVAAQRTAAVLAATVPPYSYGEFQFQAARVMAALGDLTRAARLLEQAQANGYSYDIDFHRSDLSRRLRGTAILARLSAQNRHR